MPASEAVNNVAEERRMGPLAQFAAKTAIIAVALACCSWIIISEIFDRLDDAMERGLGQLHAELEQLHAELQSATRIGGPAFWTRVEQALDDTADFRHDISQEQKQKLISDIRIIADRWRPLLKEALAVVADQPPPAMPKEPK